MHLATWIGVAVLGLAVGFLSGLFGKGGSAIATPLLHAIGLPAMVAVAAPLPATIPSTLAATAVYRREHLVDREVFTWSLALGVPATAAGALATRWILGDVLVRVTDAVIAGLGLRFVLFPGNPAAVPVRPARYRARLAAVAIVVGLVSGLLANSGGFLLAPLFIAVLRLPIKAAFASSLAIAAVLAMPGTVVHAALGHVDWAVVAVFGAFSIPFSSLGAGVALRVRADRLERLYGVALAGLGIGFLFLR